jgi:ABC-type multidrug transport system fused ATPase/permease subunit
MHRIFETIRLHLADLLRGIGLMTAREIRRSFAIVALMMLAGFLESAVVALVIPIVYVTVDPSKFAATKFGHRLGALFNFTHIGELFVYLAAILICLLILSSFIAVVSRYLSELHSASCARRLANDMLKRCMSAPYSWVLKQDSMRIFNLVLEDVRAWRRDFLGPSFAMIQAMIMIVAPTAVTVTLAPIPGLVALSTVVVIIGLIVFAVRRKVYRESYRQRELQHRVIKTVRHIVSGLREIKVSDRVDYFIRMFDTPYDALNKKTATLRAWNDAPTSLIYLLGQIGFLATGVVLFVSHSSPAEITAQLALIGFVVTRVLPAFNRFAIQLPGLARSTPYVNAILQFFDETAAFASLKYSANRNEPVANTWRKLSLDRVWVKYFGAEKWSLQDVTVELDRSGFYGFVGRSGAGKTTLANLLLGLIEPTLGSVKVDGRPLTELMLSNWQKRFGYVAQDPFILDGTVRENIQFGDSADEASMQQAVANAQLGEVIGSLAGGLDEIVGERGRQLSGGQVQRIAIARAFLRKPDILFLDEATNALDSITESELLETLNCLHREAMIIMITHRLSSLRKCDCIFVLEQGKIVAEGSYDDLMRTSKTFQDLLAQDAGLSPVEA